MYSSHSTLHEVIANLRKDYFFLEITENKLFVVDNIIS